ncbi:hypothetical protein [Hyphomonas johnsonii]|uniref:Uncharacterized protein n=1 Tax=Hyphomonas johnsonii MHS-2 TaxID=1280950 RepID=A0A059FVA9_9PROT|nr:hypothetical protein [Hyphomonas johnsonii]KCZ94446.1 hypothetical protein HJO_03690 [Hyphomonas johnsonii MHS-2]
MFSLDTRDLETIASEGWRRVASLLAIARYFLGTEVIPLPRGLATSVLTVLKPAEAMARRLLFLVAPSLSASPATAGASGHSGPPPAAGQAGPRREGRIPRFRFAEPLGPAPKPAGPWFRRLDGPPAVARPPRPMPQPATSAALLQRLAALQAVIDAPDAHARRLARWLVRRRAKCVARPVSFNFLKVPGLARKDLEPEARADLRFLNDAAFDKLNAAPG